MSAPRHTILVVEDEALIRMGIAGELIDAGFDVLEAANADEAVRLLESNPQIVMLFTDIDMPGSMDGLKLAAAVRLRWPPVKIIVTSGKRIALLAELPVDGRFYPKPYDGAVIATAFREMSQAASPNQS